MTFAITPRDLIAAIEAMEQKLPSAVPVRKRPITASMGSVSMIIRTALQVAC